MIFITYLITRLFVNIKELRIEGDEARHLKTAKTFYKMWNNQFYDFHPPLYSLLIKILSYIMPDYIAGITISFLSSIGLWWVSVKLYSALGLSPLASQIALCFLSLNYTLIYFSNRIFRYQLFALLFTSAFYCLLIHNYWLCGLLWGLTMLTCSYNGLRFFWVWLILSIFFGFNFTPLLIALPMYILFWIIPKMITYEIHEYYPSGTEGKLEKVNPFTFRQLLSPIYFPFNYAYYGKRLQRKSLKGWFNRIMGIWGLYPLNRWVYPLAGIMAVLTILGAVLSPIWLNLVVFLLLLPSFDLKYRPRNSIMVIPLIGYFIAKGLLCLSSYLHYLRK